MSENATASNKKNIPWPKIVIAVAIVASLVALYMLLPVNEWIQSALDWIESLGPIGAVVFVLFYILLAILFIPGSLLTIFAGAAYGVLWGTICVSIGSTVGASLAFLIGRHFARSKIEEKLEGDKKFEALDQAVALEGWKIVLLTRLTPIFPFNLLNYAYGLTKVKFSHYVLASWIGMIPGTVLYVYIGSLVNAVSDAGSKSTAQWIGYGIGFVATVLVTVFITKIAKKALSRKITTDDQKLA